MNVREAYFPLTLSLSKGETSWFDWLTTSGMIKVKKQKN